MIGNEKNDFVHAVLGECSTDKETSCLVFRKEASKTAMVAIALFWRNARRVFSPIRVPDCLEGIVSSDSTRKIYTGRAVFVFLMEHANAFKGIPGVQRSSTRG